MKNIRVRFSPSPSGCLHVGGARTALYNFAWAKKNNGTFIVRIEDSDADRSTPESRQIILDSLRWLGLSWNEGVDVGGEYGPYVQSERTKIYAFYAEKLISENKAYRCYCTEDELKKLREDWTKNNPKIGFKYPGICKNKPKDTSKPYVIRFAAPTEGITEFTDKAYGKISTPNCENQDWVIIRADGLPLYNWGCVIDDALMKITLVARGADHLQNTIPQILMYKALGFDVPEFCHLGLIRGKNNEKLSKRHASVSVFEYRDNGFSPEALLNYLARIGWGKGNAEVFSMNEFIEMFDWSGCGKTDGKWDADKLNAIQFSHMKSEKLISNEEYSTRTIPFLEKLGFKDLDPKHIQSLVPLIRTRSKTYVEAANELDPILRSEIPIDQEAKTKFITTDSKKHLTSLVEMLKSLDGWNEGNLKDSVNNWLTQSNISIKDINQPVRVSLTGRTNSPELFKVMEVLGKDKTINRIVNQL